jgi:hypothetical protein
MQLSSAVLLLGIVGYVGGQGGYWWIGNGAFGGQEVIQGNSELGLEGDLGLIIQDISGNMFNIFLLILNIFYVGNMVNPLSVILLSVLLFF